MIPGWNQDKTEYREGESPLSLLNETTDIYLLPGNWGNFLFISRDIFVALLKYKPLAIYLFILHCTVANAVSAVVR